MLLIYSAGGAKLSGQVIVNDSLTADFALEDNTAPGSAVCLAFEPMNIQSIQITLLGEERMSEIMLLGSTP